MFGDSIIGGSTEYDPEIIQKYADMLYGKARTISMKYALLVGLILGVMGLFVGASVHSQGYENFDAVTCALIFGITGIVIGTLIGMQKAFDLRLKAQVALCQRQIELNTRRTKIEV